MSGRTAPPEDPWSARQGGAPPPARQGGPAALQGPSGGDGNWGAWSQPPSVPSDGWQHTLRQSGVDPAQLSAAARGPDGAGQRSPRHNAAAAAGRPAPWRLADGGGDGDGSSGADALDISKLRFPPRCGGSKDELLEILESNMSQSLFRSRWHSYCAEHHGGCRNPQQLTTAEIHRGVQFAADPKQAEVVALVQRACSSNPEALDRWRGYCTAHADRIDDPGLHDVPFLRAALDWMGVSPDALAQQPGLTPMQGAAPPYTNHAALAALGVARLGGPSGVGAMYQHVVGQGGVRPANESASKPPPPLYNPRRGDSPQRASTRLGEIGWGAGAAAAPAPAAPAPTPAASSGGCGAPSAWQQSAGGGKGAPPADWDAAGEPLAAGERHSAGAREPPPEHCKGGGKGPYRGWEGGKGPCHGWGGGKGGHYGAAPPHDWHGGPEEWGPCGGGDWGGGWHGAGRGWPEDWGGGPPRGGWGGGPPDRYGYPPDDGWGYHQDGGWHRRGPPDAWGRGY